jgi:tyrosyl-tRNA synthetase
MPIFETNKQNYFISDLLFDTKLASSKKEAKRLVEGGGVTIVNKGNELRVKDLREEIKLESEMIIKVGSRKFIKIIIK